MRKNRNLKKIKKIVTLGYYEIWYLYGARNFVIWSVHLLSNDQNALRDIPHFHYLFILFLDLTVISNASANDHGEVNRKKSARK